MEILNAFTIDVEEHFQVSAFETTIPRDRWESFPSRVVANTRRLLALLDRRAVKATFFILGWTAKRQPALVREIEAAGHEIASHGFWHRLVYQQSPDEFRDDIRLGRDVLQDIVGHRVTSYRAPSFSITQRSLWPRKFSSKKVLKSIRAFFRFVTTAMASLAPGWTFIASIRHLAHCGNSLPQ